MKTMIVAAAATAALITASAAADLAPIFTAPAAAAIDPWTGPYLGAHIGYGQGNQKFFDNFPVPDMALDADANTPGWLGGLQIGINRQFGRMVVGAEGDFSWAKIHGGFSCFPFGDQVCSADAQWFGTLAGRVGATVGPTLLYVKGGAAFAHNVFTDLATCAGNQPIVAGGIPALCGTSFTGNDTRPGWVLGVGIEFLLSRDWSVKAEYNHMDFGMRSVTLTALDGNWFTEAITQRFDLVKLGINYRFDGGGPAPAAAYAYAPDLRWPAPADDEAPGKALVFAGSDVGKRSFGGWAGALMAVWTDLDTSGPRVFVMGGGGTYRYDDVRGTYSHGEILAGYAFEGETYSINLLAGPSAENHMLSELDPTNSVQGTAFGVKVRGDVWSNPTPQTLVFAEADYSTAFRTYYALGKLGFDVTKGGEIFVGPELSVFGNERYDQWRVGAHVTQLKFGRVQADVSAGYARDSVLGSGAYGRLELSTKF